MSNNLIGIIYLLITAIIWGAAFIAQYLGGEVLGAFSFIGFRCIFGCAAIFVMIIFDNLKKVKRLSFFRGEEDIKKTLISSFWCGITLFLAMATQQIGLVRTSTAKSGLIASLEVICVPILMLILYKRKIRLITWIFIFLAMFGIMMLSYGSIDMINVGDLIVLFSTFMFSITILQVPKYVSGKIDPFKFTFFRFVIIGILCFVFAFVFEKKCLTFDNIKIAMPSILFAGIGSSGIAYTFQILGQEHCEPVIATLIMSLEGVFAAIFGWMILGQTLSLLQILGCIVTTISIVVVQITDNRVR